MSERESTTKSVLQKIQEILCCQLCHNFFDFTSHKPIITFTGETFCKKCMISQKNQRSESLITNILVELIIQEISNFFETPTTKNMVYTKPGLKNNKSPSTTKITRHARLNSNKEKSPEYFFTENNDKNNLNLNNNLEEDKLANESITTIPNCEESGNVSINSFRNEVNNFIENTPSKKIINENQNQLSAFKKSNIKKLKNDSPKIYINPKTQAQKNLIFRNYTKNESGENLTYFKEHIREINDEINMKKKSLLLEKINKNKDLAITSDENKNNEQELSLNQNLKCMKTNKSISHFSKINVNKKFLFDKKTNLKNSNVSSSRNLIYVKNDLLKSIENENSKRDNQKQMNSEMNKNKNKNRVLFYSQYKTNSDYKYNNDSPFKEKLIKYKKYCGTIPDFNKEIE